MEIKKESHMQSIIGKDGELYENTKLWVSVDSLIYRINELMDSKEVCGIEIVELSQEIKRCNVR